MAIYFSFSGHILVFLVLKLYYNGTYSSTTQCGEINWKNKYIDIFEYIIIIDICFKNIFSELFKVIYRISKQKKSLMRIQQDW